MNPEIPQAGAALLGATEPASGIDTVMLLGFIDAAQEMIVEIRFLLIAIIMVMAIFFALRKWGQTQSAASAIGTALGGAALAAAVWLMPGASKSVAEEFTDRGISPGSANTDSFDDLFDK